MDNIFNNTLLLTDWAEANTALIIGCASLVGVIVAFIIGILKNESLRIAVVGRLINRVRGGQVVTLDDLQNHELKLKIQSYNLIGITKVNKIITDPYKAELYRVYVVLFTGIFGESIDNILKSDFINMTEYQLKRLLIDEIQWRRIQYAERFKNILAQRHEDLTAISAVVSKLEDWRTFECELVTDNILAVVSYGRFNSVINKLDTIFNLYTLGIDILIKNGAESFEKLNGDLTNFLNKPK